MNTEESASGLLQSPDDVKEQIFNLIKDLNEEGAAQVKRSKNIESSFRFSDYFPDETDETMIYAKKEKECHVIAGIDQKPIEDAEKLKKYYKICVLRLLSAE